MPVIRACAQCHQKNRIAAKHLADTGKCGACQAVMLPMREPLAVDAAQFDDIMQNATVPILVDFWAEWCGPCKAAAPAVARTAADMAGKAIVMKVDTEAHPGLGARFSVRGIPNFLVLYKGRTMMQQAGLVGHEQMEAWLRSVVLD